MNKHYIIKCKYCKTVIAQCVCPTEEKEVRWRECDECSGGKELCARCNTLRPVEEINTEAVIHHNAKQLECIDRKACTERIKKVNVKEV